MNLPKDVTKSKPIFKSKTAAVSALLMIGSFFDPVNKFLSESPQTSLLLIGLLYGLLRLITKDRVVLYAED